MITVLEIGERDLHRLVSIQHAIQPNDPASVASYVDRRRQAEDMAWFLATDDGEDVGAGYAFVGWNSAPGTATVEAWTVRAARGRGIGHALYQALLAWAGGRGCLAVDTSVADDDPESLAWAERRGFREVGRSSSRTLDLRTIDAPVVAPPEGIEIAPWSERPGIERALYEVYCEATPDVPGEEGHDLPSFERWLEHDMRGASDRAVAVMVAFSGPYVVGYAKLRLPPEPTDTAWHDFVAVRRAWRGKGIGRALERAQIAWAKEHGFERLSTPNEQHNISVVRLNEELGYVVEPGRITLHTMLCGAD